MRGQKLDELDPPFKLRGARRVGNGPFSNGEWSHEVELEGRAYRVSIRRGERRLIAYKPRGKNVGWQWIGGVQRDERGPDDDGARWRYIWDGEVAKSTGARGILLAAGLTSTVGARWWRFLSGLVLLARAIHGREHPRCVSKDADDKARNLDKVRNWYRLGDTPRHECPTLCEHEWREHTYSPSMEDCRKCPAVRRVGTKEVL